MPAKMEKSARLAPRSSHHVPMLDDPPLGHLQAIVAKKMDELGKDASGFKVIEELSVETGVWIDPSQVYASIRKLEGKKGFIERVATRRSEDGGPPLKIYRLTAAGRAALKAVTAHHRAVAEYLNKKATT